MNLIILEKYLIGNYDLDVPDLPEVIEDYDAISENMWFFAKNNKEDDELENSIKEALEDKDFLFVQKINFYFSQDEEEMRNILNRALKLRKH